MPSKDDYVINYRRTPVFTDSVSAVYCGPKKKFEN
jgi:hypothetical protein